MRQDLDIMDDIIESKFVEIGRDCFKTTMDVIVGVIYRPPNTDLQKFNEICSDLLHRIRTEKKLVYLAGDYNVNLLNSETHQLTSEFLEIMFSNSFAPLINKPTRVGKSSATIIDNIFTNCRDFESSLSGILYTDESDHYPVFYINNLQLENDGDVHILRRSHSKKIAAI